MSVMSVLFYARLKYFDASPRIFLCRIQKSDVSQSSLLSSGTSAQPLNSLFFTVFSLYFHCIFTAFQRKKCRSAHHFTSVLSCFFSLFFTFHITSQYSHSIQSITFCMVLYKLKQTDNTTNLHLSSSCVQPVSTFMYVMDSLLVIMT